MEIKYATFNISHCVDCEKDTKRSIIDIQNAGNFIKSQDFSIITLNEVFSNGANEQLKDQAKKLADMADMDYIFAESKSFESGDAIGNAILTKYRLKNTETYPVLAPTVENRNPNEKRWYEDRVIIKTTVVAEKTFDVITTHFGLNLTEQKNMMNKLLPLIDKETNPFILSGDFNALPNDEIIKPLFDRLTSVSRATGKENEYTWASFEPSRTIDYIFVSKEFKIKEYEVIKKVLSDHFPIMAELEL